jgi:hypothetical protein
LHGYHGSAAVLRGQMRAWAADLTTLADFVCVDAPSLAEGDHGWWHAAAEPGATRYRGWARSRDWLLAYCAREGPFDGVFGFSQGAALAALLAGLPELELAFAIVVGGFVSSDAEHAPLYERLRAARLPSLHLTGRSDTIVPERASRALAARFFEPLVLEHDGGHVVAATPAIRAATRRFLETMATRPRRLP